MLGVVGRIAKRDAEVERRHPVQGVDGLDSGVQNMGRIERNP